MIYTNDHNYPEPVMAALNSDEYTKGEADFSTTELLEPPYAVQLFNRHKHEIRLPAKEGMKALIGTAIHEYFERMAREHVDDCIVENRYYTAVIIDGKSYVVGGKIDYFKHGVLIDYKNTGAYHVVFEGFTRYEQQLNINAMLMEAAGIRVNTIVAFVLHLDHRAIDADRNEDYPNEPYYLQPLNLYGYEATKKLLTERVRIHADPNPPPCTPEERWRKPSKWAVHKKGVKRARRLCDSEDEAKVFIARNNEPGLYIDYRQGADVRCDGYCKARFFCRERVCS